MIIWLTGQPGSGKTTLANAVAEAFETLGPSVAVLDGDHFRKVMLPLRDDPYSQGNRWINIDRMQSVAIAMQKLGWFVIVAAVSPDRNQRRNFKRHNSVLEVYLTYDEDRGTDAHFVSEYEAPMDMCLRLNTTERSVEYCVEKICSLYRTLADVAHGARMAHQPTVEDYASVDHGEGLSEGQLRFLDSLANFGKAEAQIQERRRGSDSDS